MHRSLKPEYACALERLYNTFHYRKFWYNMVMDIAQIFSSILENDGILTQPYF